MAIGASREKTAGRPLRRKARIHTAAVFAISGVLAAGSAGCGGATAAANSSAISKTGASTQPENAVATSDLGEFSLRQTRPLEESTLNLRFQAHATTSAANRVRLEKLLEGQRHQLREQVIFAVRTAETWEFDEPELTRLRRRIQLRLNRWLDAMLIEDIVLTDFRFRVD